MDGISKILMKSVCFRIGYANKIIKKREAEGMELFYWMQKARSKTWQEVILVYNAALKQINTKLEILNDEFQHVHHYNPIEHIKSRIKTSESIVKKLRRHGYESTIENMVKYVNDIGNPCNLFFYIGYLQNRGDDSTAEWE